MNNSDQTTNILNIIIRLGLIFLIIAWCVVLLLPFASIVLWSIILALAAYPFYKLLNEKLGNRKKLSVVLIVLTGLLVIAIPTWLFLDSIFQGASALSENFDSQNISIPPPSESVAEWPVIGDRFYGFWLETSNNLGALLTRYSKQLLEIGNMFIRQVMGIGGSIIQMIAALIIAGILLLAKGTDDASKKFFKKIAGERGEEFLDIIQKTVINVIKGVFGVALIQATLIGVGFLLAGVPYAGLWTLLVLIIAILQMPAIIVVLPVVFYLFSELNPGPAIIWTVYLLLAGASDNVLKPILLGKGAPVPMLVIFLGVLGGFIMSGFIGLFTGAIILSIGYKLFVSWLEPANGSEH